MVCFGTAQSQRRVPSLKKRKLRTDHRPDVLEFKSFPAVSSIDLMTCDYRENKTNLALLILEPF